MLKWEATNLYYEGFSLLFDNSTCDVSSCGYFCSAELKDRVWPCSSIACSSSGASVSACCVATSFYGPMAFQVRDTDHVSWRVWDPGSNLSGRINRLRNNSEDGGWAVLGRDINKRERVRQEMDLKKKI